MKIQKFNENFNHQQIYNKAKLLASKIEKIFFSELEEFSKVVIEIDEPNISFSICFNELYKDSIKQLEALYLVLGFGGWNVQCKVFNYEPNYPKIYDFFYLQSEKDIDIFIEKLKIIEDTNKYNL